MPRDISLPIPQRVTTSNVLVVVAVYRIGAAENSGASDLVFLQSTPITVSIRPP